MDSELSQDDKDWINDYFEKQQKKQERKKNMSKELSTVDVQGIALPEEVAAFYSNNADAGAENLNTGSLPQLKVNEANSKNEMEDGQYAPPGTFYYSPTKSIFKEAEVVILGISKGFYSLANDPKDPTKTKWTQLVYGMLLDSMQPFVMFVSGTRLENLWNFGKDIRPLVKHPQHPVPMFAMCVTLSLKEIDTSAGRNHIIVFDLSKNKSGQIKLITDMGLLSNLRASIDQVNQFFADWISRKETTKEGDPISENYDGQSVDEGDYSTELKVDDRVDVEREPQVVVEPGIEKAVDDIPF